MQLHHTDQAPAAIGPYAQAVSQGDWLFTSGQIALDPSTGQIVEGGFEAQAKQVLANLTEVLSSAGCSFSNVVKATIYIVDMGNFPTLNDLYGDVLGGHRPARSTVQVAALPMGGLVEIDLVARIPG
ncbi:MAG: RidA family protein [Thermoanaerobaculia bacterium]|jgi:2-iminobutanoate/2-iminopropanoate deaminase